MDKNYIAGLIGNITGRNNVKIDELMKSHTSFKVGGPADVLVTPSDEMQLVEVLNICSNNNIPVFVIGNGTNLIVRDKGIRGVVIKLYDNFSDYTVKGDDIEAYSGILLSRLSKIALENELTGLEFAEGIPGTLGGAVTMNAGAYIGEIKDVVVKTEYMDLKGNKRSVTGEQHQFGKRTSFIQKDGGIVIKSKLKLKKGVEYEIKALMDDFNRQRRGKQPLELPSAGSIFKRPEGYFAGKLIQDCGLRGYRIGGAEVSSKHCGFIVNTQGATADDIINLITYIQEIVKARFGVELQTEVKIVGEE